jgi:sec-independent protein translocase protein TatA
MGSIGIWQVILVLAIVLIIFGAGKLPRVMGDVAKGMKNFKQGMKDEDETESAETRQINREETTDSASTTSSQNKDEAKTG